MAEWEHPDPASRKEAALARRMGQFEAIQAISAEITRELDLTRLLRLIIERALGLVGAPAGAICLWDEEHQVLIPQAWIGLGDWMGQLKVRLGQGAGGLAALRREGVLQNDYRTSPGAHPIIAARAGATAALAEPLLYRERLVGIIAANHTDTEHRFTAEDQTVLRLFATQAAIAIENARLFREEQKRVEQLDTVRAVTTEVTRELDLSRLLRLITERSVELLGGRSAAVVLWDENAQVLLPAAWQGHGDWFREVRYRLGEGIVGTVAGRRQGMVVNDYRNSPYAHPLFLLRTEIAATLAEPLLYRDRLLGVVTVDGYGEGRIFTDHDKQLLSLLASQAAIAIENARLYAATEARSIELAALREIEQAIASHLDLPAVLEAVVVGAIRLLENPYAQIILWDEANQALRFGAAQGSEAERVKNQQFKLGRGINGTVAQTREPMILDDYQASPYAEPISPDVVATITVPILFGDRLLGVLHSHTTTAGRRFTPDDLRRLQLLATQAAIAIENARLHEATQRELADRIRAQEDLKQSEEHARQLARENATMAEIGRIISSTLNIEEVYQSFADEVRKIIAFDRIVINSINVAENVVRNLYIAGEGVQERNTADLYPLEGSGNAEMVRTGASLLIQTEDFQPYADRLPALVSTFQAGFRSILNVPLFAKGRIIGGLLLRSRQLNAYTESDVRLAERIGAQIAGAVASAQLYLENTRLYEAAQREIAERRQVEQALAVRTRHLEAVRSISEEITRELDLPAVLDLIVQRAVALVGAASGGVRLWDLNQQMLVSKAWTGSQRHSANVALRLGEGVAGAAAEQRRGFIVNDFRTSSYATPTLLRDTTHGAVMATPLLYGERLVGALSITREEGDLLFVEADLEALNLFAPHASIAIENARLHRATSERARQLATLTRLTQSLVASTNAETVGKEVMAAVQALMPQAAARLWDIQGDDVGALEVLASTGLQDPRGGTVRFRRGEGLAGAAVGSRRPVVSRDLSQDPRFVNKGWAAQEKLVSAILFPLLIGEKVHGILAIFTREPHDFSETEVALFQSLASHAAIALENAWLHASAVRRNTELEALLLSNKAIGSSLDLDQVLHAIVQQAAQISASPIVRLFLLDEDAQLLRCQVAVGFPLEEARELIVPVGTSLSGQVAVTGEPLAISDTRGDPRTYYPAHVAKYGVVSYLGLPVKLQDRLLGVLVFNTPAPRTYSTDEITFLSAFAQQAAVAIENARLYAAVTDHAAKLEDEVAERLQAERALRESNSWLTAITDSAQDAILMMDPEGRVSYWNPAAERILGYTKAEALGQVLHTFIVPQQYREKHLAAFPEFRRTGRGAALGETHEVRALRKDGVEIAVALSLSAVQIKGDWHGVGIFRDITARLEADTAFRAHAHQIEAVRTVSVEITQELNLKKVLRLVAQQACALTGAAAADIDLWDPDRQLLVSEASYGHSESRPRTPRRLGEGAMGTVAQARHGMIINDYRSSPVAHPDTLAHTAITASLVEPLLYRDTLLGVIGVDHDTPGRTFTTQDQDLLNLFASQAAIAIENARTHEAAVQRAQQLGTLNEVARTLTQTLDPQRVTQEIVAAIQVLIPGAIGQLWEKVDNPQGLRLVTTVGVQEPGAAFRHRILFGEGFAGIAAASREAVISEDVTQDPRFVNREWGISEGLASGIGLPLVHGEEIQGALVIFTRARHTFEEQEVGLLKSFAAHAAVSIENARLHEAVQHHAADLEARVAERTAALEEALRVKAEFLAKMSHELRTPLNFVLGFAELLKQGTGGTLTTKQGSFVDRIVSGGKHLLDLVSDLLDMSLLEAGRKGLQLEANPLAPMVREVLDLFGIQATQKRLKLRQTVEPGLSVVVERRKLVQILTNLVANAVKFTPEGGTITVAARIADCRFPTAGSKSGDAGLQSQIESHTSKCFEITVADTGIGLAPQDVERIFRGFEQVDSSATRRHGGAGIGLALVRTLVELHGGQVWAESAGVGHGARFIVQLPHLEAPPPKRVLVVEDQIPLLKTLCVFLRDAGFPVEGVATGTEALAAIRDRRPDLVILDIGLPDIDGWEILRRVRADERTHDIRIVVLTGLGESEAEHALTLGANEFLTKPVSPTTVLGIAIELMTGVPRHPGPLPPASEA